MFNRKKNFDLKEYEQTLVNHALEDDKLIRETGVKFDMRKVSKVK